MSDELRERIADTIAISLFGPIGTVRRTDALRAADAVIEELELHYQYENGRIMYDTKPAACKANGNWRYRIVSPHRLYEGGTE